MTVAAAITMTAAARVLPVRIMSIGRGAAIVAAIVLAIAPGLFQWEG